MAFNFGKPASTGGSSGPSLFGTSKPATGGTTFGDSSKPAAGEKSGFSFGGFGQPSAQSQPSGSPSLFGTASNTPASGNIFGSGGAASTASGGLFGAAKPASAGASQPTFSFSTPDKSSAPATSGPSLFGSTTPATNSGGNLFSFGKPSTTPAGPPPATSTFGASTGGAGLFGTKPADDAAKSTTFGTGTPAAATSSVSDALPAPALAPATTSSAPGFGAKPAFGGFNFGNASKAAEPSRGFASAAATSSSDPKPALSFGAPAATTASSAAAPAPSQPSTTASSLFGEVSKQPATGSSLFSKPASSDAPTATGSSLFSKPASSDAPTASKPTFSFGAPSTQAATPAVVTATTSAPAPKSLFGGFNLGATTTSSAPAATATTSAPPATAPAASPFSFPAASTSTAAPSQPATTTASASPFSFGPASTTSSAPPASTATSAPAAAASGTPSFNVAGMSAAQTSTTGPAPPAQSRLRNKTMDEILTRWATDMSRYSKEFKEHAETIARWDQLIVDNSAKVDKLYVRTRTCERQTMSVDMQLTAVENQQSELESWLAKYEADVDEMLAKDSANPSELGGPDQEREKTYRLAEKLGERLEEMDRDLSSMVEEVNAANASLSKNGKADEPITQIVKILNSHLVQLQAIDQGTVALQERVAAAQKTAGSLGYMNNPVNGAGGAAVQDFYRSYMGRRQG